MASVFRATDLELEEQVALKVFSMTEATDVAVARFKLELKLSRQLSHPNIIRLYDIGLHDGHRYISMELLRGRSLKARMAEPFDFLAEVLWPFRVEDSRRLYIEMKEAQQTRVDDLINSADSLRQRGWNLPAAERPAAPLPGAPTPQPLPPPALPPAAQPLVPSVLPSGYPPPLSTNLR